MNRYRVATDKWGEPEVVDTELPRRALFGSLETANMAAREMNRFPESADTSWLWTGVQS